MSEISLFMDSAPDAMMLVTPEGRIRYANAFMHKLLGYGDGALIGRMVEDCLPTARREEHRHRRNTYLANPRMRMMGEGRSLTGQRADGSEFPVEISLSPIQIGNETYVLAALRDLTERRRAEAERLIVERQYRTLVNGITEYAVLLLDEAGRIKTWNAGAEQIKGYRADEIIGKPLSTFYTPPEQAEYLAQTTLLEAASHGRVETEGYRVRKNGEKFLAHVIIDAIRNDEGALVGFAKIVRDVTRIKEVEQAALALQQERQALLERQRSAEVYRRLNETLTAVLDASPAAIITTDLAGNIEIWNRAAERIYGIRSSAMIGARINHAIDGSPSFANQPPHPIFALGDPGLTIEDVSLSHMRPDGRTVDLSVSRAPLRRSEGAPDGLVYVINDVTHTKALAEQLRHSQKLEAIGQMTGGVAHDFNNLLSIIICNLELLQDELNPGSEAREVCDAAIDAGLRGADLIAQMLAFARKQTLSPKLIEVNDVIRDLMKLLQRTLGEHIEISLQLAERTCPVFIDPVHLASALTNLSTNARDAMPHGGRLAFKTTHIQIDDSYTSQFDNVTPGDYVLISVTDNGAGMAPEVAEKAFDPFFTTKRAGQGTGLGLSMVFGFVKQSGGHIRIYSELGHGTTIKLYLPCAEAHVDAPSSERPAASPAKARVGTILVVEDNLSLAKSVRSVLTDAGFTVAVAENGPQGYAYISLGKPCDLMFTDIVMPGGLNGIELARKCLGLRPDLKILFTSGFADALLDPTDNEMISGRLLTKPYRKADLLLKIRAVLESTTDLVGVG